MRDVKSMLLVLAFVFHHTFPWPCSMDLQAFLNTFVNWSGILMYFSVKTVILWLVLRWILKNKIQTNQTEKQLHAHLYKSVNQSKTWSVPVHCISLGLERTVDVIYFYFTDTSHFGFSRVYEATLKIYWKVFRIFIFFFYLSFFSRKYFLIICIYLFTCLIPHFI